MTITLRELGRRLRSVSETPLTSDEIMKLVAAAGLETDLTGSVDAAGAQRLLDQATLRVPVTGDQIVVAEWTPPPTEAELARPVAPPVIFSSPGAVDGPSDQPQPPRGRQGQRPGGRGGPRR